MSRLVACVLLLSASSTAFLVSGATINKRPSFLRRATSAFLKEDPEIEKWAQDEAAKSVVDAMYAKAAEDEEVTKWARAEAAKSVVDAMYLKAAAMIKKKLPLKTKAAFFGYQLYAAFFTVLLIKTLTKFPLIPPSPNSLAWCQAWLATTVVDYYGAALALCGVIISSEPKLLAGLAWSAGCLFLGTPFCCFYVATRMWKFGSLKLTKE